MDQYIVRAQIENNKSYGNNRIDVLLEVGLNDFIGNERFLTNVVLNKEQKFSVLLKKIRKENGTNSARFVQTDDSRK